MDSKARDCADFTGILGLSVRPLEAEMRSFVHISEADLRVSRNLISKAIGTYHLLGGNHFLITLRVLAVR